ncbi:hypothetical protein J1N10_21015 [Carboxylicivirga sp. A043]|uniref:hypothetical protein n=1 Tax=Carboxylicivirga litoralis TaxID=2816963 RepID=UPI0021CB1F70|nr:hypothetical protein [Carboxylicivirga sp. A043]MCU4158464.1 hypothetical protein [Carboxylicivirga sp. A043]
MKIKHWTIISFILLVTINTFGQSNKIELKDIIEGTWNIEFRGTVVTFDNPDGGNNKNTNSEIIQKTDKAIEFKNGAYKLDSGKSGKYIIKGAIYLDGKKYRVGVHNKDKFNLIRMMSPDYMLTYMLTRKKE